MTKRPRTLPARNAVSAPAPRGVGRGTVVALVVAGVLAAAVAFVLLFDWSMVRAPLERRIAETTGQPASIGAVDVGWRGGPRIVLRDVVVGTHAPEADRLLQSREIALRLRPWPLLLARVHLAELGLGGARINLRRDAQGQRNWLNPARQPAEPSPDDDAPPAWRTLRVDTLALDDVVVTYRDAKLDADATITVDGEPPPVNGSNARNARSETAGRSDKGTNDAQADSAHGPQTWRTHYTLSGRHEKTKFTGEAWTGPLLTLRDTDGTPFPFRGVLQIATTRIQAEGTVSDALGDAAFDVRLGISGPTLAAWYPTVPVVLPGTPPYRIDGRLQLADRVFNFEDLRGRIGTSDISGEATFDARPDTPMLTAKLQSQRMALSDLGATIGVPAEGVGGAAARLLPDASFDLPRMNAMNADVTLRARQVVVNRELPFQAFEAHIVLNDGVLRLSPLAFGFSGGQLTSTVMLDARQQPMQAEAAIDARRINLAQLVPATDGERITTGPLGAQIRLKGSGASVAQLLGNADGRIAAAMSGGRISRAAVAAASLDGGKLLPLLLTGDKPVEIRCIAMLMGVDDGVARTELLVGDFTTARVDGAGFVDLGEERLQLEIRVLPKESSLLSLRAPLHITGTLRDPDIGVGSEALLRGGAAIALGLINPLAALLPLIETGPGEDANCGDLLAAAGPAVRQAEQPSKRPPTLPGKSASGKRAARE